MRVFVTRDLPGSALDRLRRDHDVSVWQGETPPSKAELMSAGSTADALLTLLTEAVDDDVLDACRNVRAVSNYAVGFENIDVASATRRGIAVGHTPGVLTEATAQLTITLILDLMRRVSEASKAVHEGRWKTWEPSGYLGRSLSGTMLGLIGYGRIGRAVADMASALGMKVIHTDPSDRSLPIEHLLGDADVVSLHATLTPETTRLINERTLALMKPQSLLVNVARGPMIDTDALVLALQDGHIAGAALDVTDPEPLPPTHELLSFKNVIVTPHIASATVGTRAAMADLAVDNLLRALDGQPMPHCANPTVYENSTTDNSSQGRSGRVQ